MNRHAEGTVRIQSDRNHAVVTDGPYAHVRHPIYVGTVLGLPAVALVLGSAWSLVPMALVVLDVCLAHGDGRSRPAAGTARLRGLRQDHALPLAAGHLVKAGA